MRSVRRGLTIVTQTQQQIETAFYKANPDLRTAGTLVESHSAQVHAQMLREYGRIEPTLWMRETARRVRADLKRLGASPVRTRGRGEIEVERGGRFERGADGVARARIRPASGEMGGGRGGFNGRRLNPLEGEILELARSYH